MKPNCPLVVVPKHGEGLPRLSWQTGLRLALSLLSAVWLSYASKRPDTPSDKPR